MAKVIPFVFAAFVFLLPTASFGAGESATSGLTAGELIRMEKGGVVLKAKDHPAEDGTSSARIKAYCVINRPPEAVWAVMLNYHTFSEFMPRLEKVEVLEKTQGTMKVTETVHVPLGVIVYTIDLIFKPEQQTVSWTLDKSRKHDIAETFGTWEFLPYGHGRTMLRYTTSLDSGMFIPRFVEDMMIKKDLSNALLSLKRRTESDGTWKKKK
ncbi:SRPBCC family protein [Candidatus Methylomirabilis sp.]|uniref:type II toxin-antitoxin system RatA family toxin n=1 Tax=Candidatus Methylomirabilis sp. TaxID=2032687 RepID=UPI002A63ADE0|nr:SRPBCC family protein [Candidatus Methylomirabilis sp.]